VRRLISAGSGDFAFARKFVTQHYQYSESSSEPASILPSQFFDGQKKKEAVEPLKRLMLAVLADAVRCYQTGFDRRATSRRRAFLEAQQWLFRPGADGAFSFETGVTSSILLPIIFVRCCATGGPEGLAALASPSSAGLR
jgi:hypothetical protein